jgi:8-oxo-dGTP pyrophosphatase MutT (NUDIX family)
MATDPSIARPVPVVRLIIPDEDGKVLILKRARTAYGEGGWCLPGGKIDYGELVEQAVSKELQEETALECERARFLFYQDSLPPEPGSMHCINLYFECSVAGDLTMNPESSDWAWIGPDQLGEYDIVFRNDEALTQYWAR